MYGRAVSLRLQGFFRGCQNMSALVHHELGAVTSQQVGGSSTYMSHASLQSDGSVLPQRETTWCQRRLLHLSTHNMAVRLKNSRKKLTKTPNVNKKGIAIASVQIHQNMTVNQLASAIGRGLDHVFEVLIRVPGGEAYHSETSVIDNIKVIQEVVRKSGMKCQFVATKKQTKEKKIEIDRQPDPDPSVLVKRPPVVTIMGHVDHGKTTLLDRLRQSKIVDQEFGGITQHIGAFTVKLGSGESICFLDTPGHAAFSAMRARGARVTDMVVLVVAADDGVMQQTVESMHHAQAAGVPIIIAINKIDKFDANVEQTKHMLLEHQLVLEEFGGDIQAVPISALKGTNMDLLQETIVTQAELMDLKGDPVGKVEGRIIEAKVDNKRGKLATMVVQRGTLKKGDILVAGKTWVKVRAMFDDRGRSVQNTPPSTPVEILGWKEVPSAGDEVLQVASEPIARQVTQWRQHQVEEGKAEESHHVIQQRREEHQSQHREEMQQRVRVYRSERKNAQKTKEIVESNDGPQFSLVLKGDVGGSLEALTDTLNSYNSRLCRLDLLHCGIGNVTESDVELAEAFDGEIFAFNVDAPSFVSEQAAIRGVPLRMHKVIYHLFNDLRQRITARLPMLKEEDVTGEAEVLQVFFISEKRGKACVAGCRCIKGSLNKKNDFKVLRQGEIIYQGKLASLKHFKSEVETVNKDRECGIRVNDSTVEFQVGDVICCYVMREVEPEIDWDPGF